VNDTSPFTSMSTRTSTCLQQALLDRWLGPRDDLCVVGDDYQSIYGFTGATPEHLLRVPEPLPARRGDPAGGELPLDAAGARTGEPLGAEAGRGREGAADPPRPDGPEPEVRPFATGEAEGAFLVETIRAAACPLEEIAVPLPNERPPGRLEPVLHEAGSRTRARRCSRARRPGGAARCSTRRRRRPRRAGDRPRPGWLPQAGAGLGDRELARQATLAARPARGGDRRQRRRVPAELERRFGDGRRSRRGVHLLTYHGAKGSSSRSSAAAAGGEGAAVEAGARPTRSTRSGASSTSADAGEARARRHLGREAEPVPDGADGGRTAGGGATGGVRVR
jgi:DNA helicase-2/ATP-dependent DNA helicase PcrA